MFEYILVFLLGCFFGSGLTVLAIALGSISKTE